MNKIIILSIISFSPISFAIWSAFAHITPKTDYGYHIEFKKEDGNPNAAFKVKMPVIGYDRQKTWLVLTSCKIDVAVYGFREYLWVKERANEKTISITELKPKQSKEGLYYEQLLTEDQARNGYIYVDYPRITIDGGFYYAVDLNAYLIDFKENANK